MKIHDRIRELAADWLGDVGERALRAATEALRPTCPPEEIMQAWRDWGRSVGAAPSEATDHEAVAGWNYVARAGNLCDIAREATRATDAAGAPWRRLDQRAGAPATPSKPDTVEVGQFWRVVGVDDELEVERLPDAGYRNVELKSRTGWVYAKPDQMLGLKEWSFVRARGATP